MVKHLQFNLFPAWSKALLFFMVLWLATCVAGIVPILNNITFFLVVSFCTTYIFMGMEGRKLGVLGFIPKGKLDWQNFFSGLGIGIVMLLLTSLFTITFSGDKVEWNRHFDPIYLIILFGTCLYSAFIQEITFRGYPFQTLLRRYGAWPAQLLIVIPFGIMHMKLGMGMGQMAIVLLTTGLGSILYGVAYLKTNKLILSIGLHMGWNFAQELIPRAISGQHKGLIIISNCNGNHSVWVYVVPYVVITLLSILMLSCSKAFK